MEYLMLFSSFSFSSQESKHNSLCLGFMHAILKYGDMQANWQFHTTWSCWERVVRND